MKRKIAEKIDDQVKNMDNEEPDRFNSNYNSDTRRLSYDVGIRDHFFEELQFIAGVLDMLVVLSCQEHLDELREETAFVLMDARHRAIELGNLL